MEIAAFVLSCVVGVWAIISTFIAFNQNRKIEKLKARLDTGAYISKSRFDVEFECYRKLSRELGLMIKDNSKLYPAGLYYESSKREERINQRVEIYRKAVASYNQFYSVLSENEAVVSEAVYDSFFDILQLCKEQLALYDDFRIEEDKDMLRECREEYTNCWKRTSIILEKRSKLSKMLREYMATLNSDKKKNK